MGGWEYINDAPRKLQAVTAEDIKRVANTYFSKTNRAVAIYTRKPGLAPEDPDFLALQEKLGPQMADQVRRQLQGIKSQITDPAALDKIISDIQTNLPRFPEQMRPGAEYMLTELRKLQEELAARKGS